MSKIERLSEEQAKEILPHLVELLQDSVECGASVGFMPPLLLDSAEEFWLEIFREITEGKRILLVSSDEAGEITGAVQLALAAKENDLHRAEVQKLLVHTRFRNRGIAGSLMCAVENIGRKEGRTLLVLDTEQGSAAEKLYVNKVRSYTGGRDSAVCSQRGRLVARYSDFLSFAIKMQNKFVGKR